MSRSSKTGSASGRIARRYMSELMEGSAIRVAQRFATSKGIPLPFSNRVAIEFDTEEQLKKYLEKHPNADPKNHSVKGKGKGKGGVSESKEEALADLLDIDRNIKKFQDKTPATEDDIEAFKSHPAVKGLGEDFNLKIIAGDRDKPTRGGLLRAAHVAAHLVKGIGKGVDFCNINPPACKGNLGITRDNMPQILDKPLQKLLDSDNPVDRKKAQAAIDAGAKPADNVQDLWFDKLRDEGVDITDDEIPVGDLIASQAEIKAGKAYSIAKDFITGNFDKLPDLPILVARDPKTGRVTVIDGHHRYAGLLLADPKRKMKVKVIETDIQDALDRAFSVPGVFRADLQDNIVDADKPLDLARKPNSTWKQRNGKFYAKNAKGETGGPFKTEKAAKDFASGKKASQASGPVLRAGRTLEVNTAFLLALQRAMPDWVQNGRAGTVIYTHPDSDFDSHFDGGSDFDFYFAPKKDEFGWYSVAAPPNKARLLLQDAPRLRAAVIRT